MVRACAAFGFAARRIRRRLTESNLEEASRFRFAAKVCRPQIGADRVRFLHVLHQGTSTGVKG
jgi:hypothetical protein